MAKVEVVNADIMEWCKTYTGEKFHSALMDPPYHLTSIVKRFSKGEPSHTKTAHDIANRSTPHARQARGFMSQEWDGETDGVGVAFNPETWYALKQHLYPGAFICAFAGTRGYHRMATAIEEAGYVVHPCLIWNFSTGFPKATNISAALQKSFWRCTAHSRQGKRATPRIPELLIAVVFFSPNSDSVEYTDTAAKQWSGHRYGLQALKPALELICIAQVPYSGKPLDCIVNTGAGALNIDDARIGVNGGCAGAGAGAAITCFSGGLNGTFAQPVEGLGRWPSNLILSEETAVLLDAQSGVSIARAGNRGLQTSGQHGGLAGDAPKC